MNKFFNKYFGTKSHKIAFAISMIIVLAFSWIKVKTYEIEIEKTSESYYGSYYLNQNWLEIAIHGDNDEIVGYIEIPAADNEYHLTEHWILADESVDEYNFEAKGYNVLWYYKDLYEKTGRYITSDTY